MQTIQCEICRKIFKQIQYRHLKQHGLTVEEYKKKFPNARINSEESARTRSESLKGRTIYWAKKISDAVKESWKENPDSGRSGVPLSDESREKLSKKLQGHYVSDETKAKIGIAGLGREPWNKNLTKESDERLLSVSEKVKEWNKESMTDEKKERISQTLKKKYSEGMKIPNSKNGRRIDLNRSFRSTWEANYARMLNYENKKWSYEEHKFPFYDESGKIICVYTPDFYVDEEHIELKGHADSENDWSCNCRRCERDRIRTNLFKERHPDKVLRIIGRKEYREMAEKYGSIIDNWEKTCRG